MITVEIYSKTDCHLCETAKETLHKISLDHPFEIREILIREVDENYEQFKERIPVIFINKKYAFQYRVREQEFISRLKEEEATFQ